MEATADSHAPIEGKKVSDSKCVMEENKKIKTMEGIGFFRNCKN